MLTWESTCMGEKTPPTNIAFRSWLCDITTALPSTDTASSAGLNIPLAAGRKHSESALKYHQSANQNHETKKCLSIFVYILSGANKLKCYVCEMLNVVQSFLEGLQIPLARFTTCLLEKP